MGLDCSVPVNPITRFVTFVLKKTQSSKHSSLENLAPPKNGVIALWPNTRVVKCKHFVSQKQNGFNNKIHWYSVLLTFLFKSVASASVLHSAAVGGSVVGVVGPL